MPLPKSTGKIDPELRYSHDFLTGSDVRIGEREMPDAEARFAMQLLTTNGILMGDDGGEDSTGRARMKAMDVGPLVTRAFDIANEAYAQARDRGCMLLLPDDAEIKERAEAEREAAEAAKEERRRAREEAKRVAPIGSREKSDA
jgi:hypothetical protein